MKYDLNDLKANLIESPVYHLQGMTCQGCANSIQNHLNKLAQVSEAKVDKQSDTLQLTLTEELTLSKLNDSLQSLDSKYLATPLTTSNAAVSPQGDPAPSVESTPTQRSWFSTYKPILLIFSYLVAVTALIQYLSGDFQVSVWMRHFMAGFFLIFSFFKLLNLKAFAQSYQMYDIIAKRWPSWGYIYAFIELGLGLSYVTGLYPLITNSIALGVMSVSIIGVLRSVLNRQQIQCACLGDVFNLPMSTVTIIEDGMMIVMSGWMLTQYL